MMKMRMIVAAMVLCMAVAGFAAVQRELSEQELADVTVFIAAQNEGREGWSESSLKSKRDPVALIKSYERHKFDKAKRRWKTRPKFPGWDDKCYRWNANGKSYQSQLYCSKCKAKPGCNGWVNPTGHACNLYHPVSVDEQWKFCVRLIATDYKKPTEAKAHLWNAHQHEEITDANWDSCMAAIDSIVAAQEQAAAQARK